MCVAASRRSRKSSFLLLKIKEFSHLFHVHLVELVGSAVSGALQDIVAVEIVAQQNQVNQCCVGHFVQLFRISSVQQVDNVVQRFRCARHLGWDGNLLLLSVRNNIVEYSKLSSVFAGQEELLTATIRDGYHFLGMPQIGHARSTHNFSVALGAFIRCKE